MMLNPTATVVYGTSSDIPEFICPGIDTLQLIEEDSLSSLEDNDFVRLAKGFELNISTSNSGTWETIGDYNVWRYKVTSYYAYSMNVLLEDINIPENASIFIYDDDMSYVVGPIQYSVNQYGVYHSEFIPGSSIIVEVVVYGEIDPTVPYLTITGVSHDYNDFVGYTMGKDNTRFSKRIRNCADKDVNCSLGTGWQTHKRSVALMVMKSKTLFVIPNDLYAGTGALINNTNFDGKSLFLTARHCVSSNARAKELIFYFNHESNGCGENKEHPYNFSVSGATVLSTNAHTDFTLLELHGKVPSSYYPYLAGWDKNGTNLQNGVGIHHPKGNFKKIAIDNDEIYPNPITRTITTSSYSYTFDPNTMWDVYFDEGSVLNGSSGSPLFNENKKIVGQLFGTDQNKQCTSRRLYGRLSVSWNYGSTKPERLKEWLDPLDQNPNEISGYIPAGWRNDWLTGWNQPSAHKTHPQVKSIAVGEGGQVFYRGTDNKMQVYYYDGTNWVHDWVRGWSIPSHELIAGDVVVGEGNQLFYRGTDGKIHTYYWTTSGWQHDWLTGWNSPSHENVSAVPGSIAVGNGNQVFYRGTDNKMHTYYWTTSGWQHAWIVNAAPSWQNVAGDIVVGKRGGQNQVYYRGTDGKMQVYWFNFSTSQWNHGWITSGSSPSYENVSSVAGSIAVGSDNKIYYRGTDNLVHLHYWEAGSWHHGWMINGAGSDQKISGNITVNNGDQVFYRGFDGKMHVYWYNNTANEWVHDWIENSWQAPTLNNIAGSIDAGNGGSIFYRANNDGLVRVYFWGNSAMLRPSKNEYYGMEDVTTKPKIPMYNSTLEMTAYPNPVETILNVNISTNQDDKYLFTLTDVSGRVVLSEVKQLSKGFNKIDIQLSNTVNSGLYILSAQNQRTLESVQTKISKL